MLFGNTTINAPSRFITEIKEELLDKSDYINQMEEKNKPFNKSAFYSDESIFYQTGEVVFHSVFGRGVVVNIDNRFVTVAFNNRIGIKKFLSTYQGLKKEKK